MVVIRMICMTMVLIGVSAYAMDRKVVLTIEEAREVINSTKPERIFIIDNDGYTLDGTKITFTAPYQLTHPEKIQPVDPAQIRECVVRLHTYGNTISVAPLCAWATHVKTLQLHNMAIKNVVYALKFHCYTLDTFEISGSDITNISLNEIERSFPNITKLRLAQNKIETITPVHQTYARLQNIDLSHNQLKDIDLNVLLNSSLRLQEVDLSNNPLGRVACDTKCTIEHYESPVVRMVNSALNKDQKVDLIKMACVDNPAYVLLKRIVPWLFVCGSLSGICAGAQGEWDLILIGGSLAVPSGLVMGRLIVDYTLFYDKEDRYIRYFKPVFSDSHSCGPGSTQTS